MVLSKTDDPAGNDSSSSNNNNTDKAKRAFATHTPMWQRFQTNITHSADASLPQSHLYNRQYSHVYAQRLAMLKPRCLESFQNEQEQEASDSESPAVARVPRILELREQVLSLVVGTLVKEHGDGGGDETTLVENHKSCANDVLYLEDESGRVCLHTNQVHQFATGAVVAVKGTVHDGGLLHVDRFYLPAPAPMAKVPSNNVRLEPALLPSCSDGREMMLEEDDRTPTAPPVPPPHLLLVSGLQCGHPDSSSLARDMLLSFLEGQLHPKAAAKICRVLVLGGCTHIMKDPTSDTAATAAAAASKEATATAVQDLDAWLAQLCAAGVPVDVLPGQGDPTTANWPQRPLHSSLLKYSGGTFQDPLLSRTPNPYLCGMGDKVVLATDGRNVQDLKQGLLHSTDKGKDTNEEEEEEKFTPYSELDALQQTLEFGHLCPTGPDSVPTVPHAERDPMVISETPHLYVCGNCEQFDTKVWKRSIAGGATSPLATRLVCVPQFFKTGDVVLVNLETLECEMVRFEDSL